MPSNAALLCGVVLLSTAMIQVVRFEPYQADVAAAATLTNALADFDGDGDLDLFVGFNGTANRLYRNDSGKLAEIGADAGVADARATRAAAWGDFDSDGDVDLLLGFAPGNGPILRLYRNDAGRFQDATAGAGLLVESGAVRQPAWIDIDGDNDLDLFIAFRDRPNALYRNDGGRFADQAASIGLADTRKTVGAIWFDFDQDGDLDLYAANQDGDPNGLFRNDGGRFTDVAEAAGVSWGGRPPREATRGTVRPCAEDVNGDGRFDLFMANYGPNGLFLNTGGGRFEDVSAGWGVAIEGRYDTCAFTDVDNDGHADLFVNGTVTGGVSYRDYLFRNVRTRFEDVTPAELLQLHASHGVQWADLDRDGASDLVLAGSRPDVLPLVWRNKLARADVGRSLAVRVLDARGHATRAGAEVRVYTAGARTLLGTRRVDSGSGYNAQNDAPVIFGVGSASRVDVEVTFPSSGRREVARIGSVETGGSNPLVVRIGGTPEAPTPSASARVPDVIFVPTRESVIDQMLTLAEITASDVVYDLGSGDGRIVMLAAQKYGARGVGVEIDEKLVNIARAVARDGEVGDRVQFVHGDLFEADIRPATLVAIYLSPGVNARLAPRLRAELRPGTRIVSHQFPLPDWKPEKTVVADDGTELYLYVRR